MATKMRTSRQHHLGIVPTYFEEFYFDCVDLYESLSDLKWLNLNQSYARRSPYRS